MMVGLRHWIMLVVIKIANQIYQHKPVSHQQAYRTVSGQSSGSSERPEQWCGVRDGAGSEAGAEAGASGIPAYCETQSRTIKHFSAQRFADLKNNV